MNRASGSPLSAIAERTTATTFKVDGSVGLVGIAVVGLFVAIVDALVDLFKRERAILIRRDGLVLCTRCGSTTVLRYGRKRPILRVLSVSAVSRNQRFGFALSEA